MTAPELLRCHHCRERLAFDALNQPGWVTCGACGSQGAYWVFPAYYRAEIAGQVAPSRFDAQASCFFHPEKAASVACDGCGRFLCAVCDIHLGRDHLCTSCLRAGKTHPGVARLENERVLHDSITLMIAFLTPLVFWPLVPFTAPYAVYRSIRYFNQESSIVGHHRWRLIVAILLATAQIIATFIVIYLIVTRV